MAVRVSRPPVREPDVRGVDAALVAHAVRTPEAIALVDPVHSITYGALDEEVTRNARAFARLGLRRGDRVAIVASKRIETVSALLGALRFGAVCVPLNSLLKPDQLGHVLADSGARVLLAPNAMLATLAPIIDTSCPALVHRIPTEHGLPNVASHSRYREFPGTEPAAVPEADDVPALILYTSGSTARPKGVVLDRSNLAHGAASVAAYLENGPEDRLLALLPLSFDYGLYQVLTALAVGARAILFDYLLPKGVIAAVIRHRITGLAAVPHLWNLLARLDWPDVPHLRYVTTSGGRMPVETTRMLERELPDTRVVLMYGFTEAFRSTWLPPAELVRRPDSIGKAVPHATVFVVDEDGRECAPGEVGELIHGGPLVATGYWNDERATRAKFRSRFRIGTAERLSDTHDTLAVPDSDVRGEGTRTEAERGIGDRAMPDTERFAWSGDLARTDEDGYIYFVSRREDIAKLHGFRVNPVEIEEAIDRSPLVHEVSVVCVPHPSLGQAAIAVLVADEEDIVAIERHCRDALPRFMQPEHIVVVDALPTSPNSKVDRPALRARYDTLFEGSSDAATPSTAEGDSS